MSDLNPSPGVWVPDDDGWLSTLKGPGINEFVVEAEMGETVVIPNPDDAIVIRYAGELYRRVCRWRRARDEVASANLLDLRWKIAKVLEEEDKAGMAVADLLDEMQREAKR